MTSGFSGNNDDDESVAGVDDDDDNDDCKHLLDTYWKAKQIYCYQPRGQSTPAYRQGPPQSKRCAGIYYTLVIIVVLS